MLVSEPITVDYPYTNCVSESGMVLFSPKAYCCNLEGFCEEEKEEMGLGKLSVAVIWKTVAFFKIIYLCT